jgi:hypothetical protein
MGLSKPKLPKIEPPKASAPAVTTEDEASQAAGSDRRRRLAAMMGRDKTVTSMRPAQQAGMKNVLGV